MLLFELDKPTSFDQIKPGQIASLEIYIDRLFSSVGLDVNFTRHFKERLTHARNKKPITISELQRLFKKVHRQMHKGKDLIDLGADAQAVLKDLQSDINIPFIIEWDRRNREFDFIAKTVMRKPDFKTSNEILAVENVDVTGMQMTSLLEDITKKPELYDNTDNFEQFISAVKSDWAISFTELE